MAKSLLKKAKKAVKSVKQKVETFTEDKRREDEEDPHLLSVSKAPKVGIRKHIEKLSGERRDCAAIWTLIKNTNQSQDEVLNLIKAKGYETLLGELS